MEAGKEETTPKGEGGESKYNEYPIPITSDVTRGREEEKRDTNDNYNPREVQVHMWEVEAAEEVKDQDWGL